MIEFQWGKKTLTARLKEDGTWECEDPDAAAQLDRLTRPDDYSAGCGYYDAWAAQKAAKALGGKVVSLPAREKVDKDTVF